jgi:hypothetical protein
MHISQQCESHFSEGWYAYHPYIMVQVFWNKYFGLSFHRLVHVLNWNILSSMSFCICVWHRNGWLKTFFSKIKVQFKTKTNKNRNKPVWNDIWWITIQVVLLKFRFVTILSRLSFLITCIQTHRYILTWLSLRPLLIIYITLWNHHYLRLLNQLIRCKILIL